MIGSLPSFFKSPHEIAGVSPCEPVLVALSGGADSSALLHLTRALQQLSPFPLYAAHVNHNIRRESFGNEAIRDESFCRELCGSLGVELFVKSIDVPALAKETGGSLETVAREARYNFFAEIMRKKGIKILVTAHNADDNFETQLFNLCRGCGIDGLCGIPECRPFPEGDGIIARPILSASKAEILELCHKNGIEYVTDSTNLLDDCTRNKLRLNVIPQLKEIFTSPERSGARLATYAREDSEFIASEAEGLFLTLGDRMSCEILLSSPPSLSKRAIRMAFGKLSSEILEGIHVESLLRFAAEKKNGKISLPDGISAVFEDGQMTLEREADTEAIPSPYNISLTEGITYINGTPFAVSVSRTDLTPPPDGYMPYDTATLLSSLPLSAKSRREGDRILTGGMHKRIKKLMCDKKVPTSDRNSLPLIFSEDELIYAPLCAVSDSARADKDKLEIKISIHKKI